MTEYNLKKRELWCPKCKKYQWTDEVGAVCQDCFGTTLITVVYSQITGEKITGNELGKSSR